MGIKPSGLGLRLKSLQLQPLLALVGDRCPFVVSPFGVTSTGLFGILEDVIALAGVRAAIFMGLLLFDLALLNSAFTSSSSSRSSLIGSGVVACFFFADLVTGPKYPSDELSRGSEGVGEGEMTLGVAGTELDADRAMEKGCSDGIRITPFSRRSRSMTLESQVVEWRCLSLREARFVVTGEENILAIESSVAE